LPRFVTRAVTTFLAVTAAAVGLAACGGDDNAELDPADVMVETLGNDEHITSGTFDFSLGGSMEGTQAANADVSLDGAFQGGDEDPAALPQLQLDGTVSGDAAGQTIDFEGGLTVTADNAYVTYESETYELGASLFNGLQSTAAGALPAEPAPTGTTGAEGATASQCPTLLEQAGGNPEACDEIDALSWFDLTNEGTEEIDGTDTIHIHGEVDIAAMIDNVNAAIAASEVPDAEEIPEETATQLEEGITELSFDLYSGAEDRILRGFDLNVVVDAAAIEDARDAGVSGAEADLSLRLGAINETQTIEAPADAQPIDDLLEQFGLSSTSLGSLLSAQGLPGAGTPDLDSLSENP
jgi:hypothetical protein